MKQETRAESTNFPSLELYSWYDQIIRKDYDVVTTRIHTAEFIWREICVCNAKTCVKRKFMKLATTSLPQCTGFKFSCNEIKAFIKNHHWPFNLNLSTTFLTNIAAASRFVPAFPMFAAASYLCLFPHICPVQVGNNRMGIPYRVCESVPFLYCNDRFHEKVVYNCPMLRFWGM